MKKVKEIIKEIEEIIATWKEDRDKIAKDVFQNYLYDKNIDYAMDDMVIREFNDLLNFVKESKGEGK